MPPDYMRAANVLDETAFDYFTLSLWQSQWTARKSSTFWEMVRYHELYEQRLRLARGTDERKWGMTWVKPEEMRENLQKLREAREQVLDEQRDVRSLSKLRMTGVRQSMTNEFEGKPGVNLDRVNEQIAQARMRMYKARTNANSVAPPMPTEIPVDLPR